MKLFTGFFSLLIFMFFSADCYVYFGPGAMRSEMSRHTFVQGLQHHVYGTPLFYLILPPKP